MQDTRGGNPAVNQCPESPPVHASLLTAQAQLSPPESDDPPPECAQGTHSPWHRMVVEVALHDRPQPLARGRDGLMAALPQLLIQRFQLRYHALTRGLTADGKVAGLLVPLTDMREAQKVERFRLAFAPLLSVRDGVWPKLD